MKKSIFPLALLSVIASSCSDTTDLINSIVNPEDKEMISFSLSDGTTGTRAGFIGSATSLAMRMQSDEKLGSGKKYTRTVANADKDITNDATSYSVVTFQDSYKRYWDDAHGRKSLLSVFAVAIPNGGSSIKNNGKTLEELLTKGDASKDWGTNSDNTIEWTVTTSEQKKDPSTATSPTENIDKEDLVYANNIQSGGTDGVYRDYSDGNGYVPTATGDVTHRNGQMLFFQGTMTDANAATTANTDAPGKFDKGHLKFNHALSRISVKLVAGTGFAQAATGSFDLSSAGIQFLGMNIKGKLDIPTGVWTPDATTPTGTIVTKPTRKTTDDGASPTPAITSMYYETVAQMLPNYEFVDGNNTNVMEFTIDDNTYFITKDMIYDALNVTANQKTDYGYDATNSKFTMQQGKNYSFEITINKKQIEAITATLKDWDNVSAEFAQDNTHITITTSRTGDEHNDELNLFKMEQDLGQIYTDDSYFNSAKGFSVFQGNYKASGVANLQEMKKADDSSYDPKQWYADGWYYKDNKTAYHLRMLNNLAADENGNDGSNKAENVSNTATPEKSYFTMHNGAQSTQDYHWGAPMIQTTDANFLKYNLTEGYSSSIHPGFVAPKNYVNNPINITELHMMSNINVILKTTTNSNAINLRTGTAGSYEYATVKITKLYSEATVDMGSGLVTPTGAITTEQTMTQPTNYFAPVSSTDPTEDITTTQAFTWAVVPQTLVRTPAGTGTEHLVGITITTPDNNEYYIVTDLSKIVPSGVGSQVGQMHATGGTNYINRWYPNHSYTYTFTLTKKGIEAITCTLADWVTVTGQNTNIDLEN